MKKLYKQQEYLSKPEVSYGFGVMEVVHCLESKLIPGKLEMYAVGSSINGPSYEDVDLIAAYFQLKKNIR